MSKPNLDSSVRSAFDHLSAMAFAERKRMAANETRSFAIGLANRLCPGDYIEFTCDRRRGAVVPELLFAVAAAAARALASL